MIYECHGHIILDGIDYKKAIARHKNGVDEDFIRNNLQANADKGIKFYRDGGDKHGASVFARKIAWEYCIDYRTPAYIIHKKGFYGGMFGRAFKNMAEYRDLVAEAKQLGADYIKTTASGMIDFADNGSVLGKSMSEKDLCEMVNIAHGEGFAVMIHVNGSDNIIRAAEAGVDSIEHGFHMDSNALAVLSQSGAVWVPTITTVANLITQGLYSDRLLVKIFNAHYRALKDAYSLGIPIACGSDAGASYVPQGVGTLHELSHLKSFFINPERGNRIIEEVFRREC